MTGRRRHSAGSRVPERCGALPADEGVCTRLLSKDPPKLRPLRDKTLPLSGLRRCHIFSGYSAHTLPRTGL